MSTYVVRRLLLFVPALLGASMLIFVLMRLVPGDIAEILVYQAGSETSGIQQKQIQQIRSELGLERPVMIQYLSWIGGAVRGDFGKSYAQRRPVWDILRERFPRSMELAILTLAIALVWAIPLGVVSAVHQNGPLDYLARIASLSGLSMPLFVTGALILYGLVRLFHWIPPLEFVAFTEDPVENLKQLIWPALAQAYYISAPITRLTRSQMLEVIRQDYVRTARAKGLAERAVVYRHALQELAPARRDLRRLVGRPAAGRARHHGDHLRRAGHGDGARPGGEPARLPDRPGHGLRHGRRLPGREPRRGPALRLARPADPLCVSWRRRSAVSSAASRWARPAGSSSSS